MNFGASLYSSKPRRQTARRQPTQQDLIMYEAIVGKPANISPAGIIEVPLSAGIIPTRAVARRWKPVVVDLTVRLRTMYDQRITQNVKPQVADWWKNVSEEASRRLDEAQVRLQASRNTVNRRRVQAREVSFPIRPVETARPAKAA